MSSNRFAIVQGALRRVEFKEAHSALSGPVLMCWAYGRSVWLGGVFLTAAISVLNLYCNHAQADDGDVSGPTINVSVHEALLTLRAEKAPLSKVLQDIGQAAGFRVVLSGTLDTPVTWYVADVPLEKALRRLLGHRSYVMTY